MNVRVHMLFESPGPDEQAAMLSLARSLTNRLDSVHVLVGEKPGWLMAAFTMPTEAQYRAVDRIDWAMKSSGILWEDSVIDFPKTEAERARAVRKAEKRRARRRAR